MLVFVVIFVIFVPSRGLVRFIARHEPSFVRTSCEESDLPS